MNNKSKLAILTVVILFCVTAFAREQKTQQVTPEVVQKAAQLVPALRAMMKDPDSFVLEGAFVSDFGSKKHPDSPEFCFAYRAHNSYGGYGDTGLAFTDYPNTIRIADNWALREICNPKIQKADITEQVKAALAPPPPPAESPADAAAKAQQYADCLKAAVNNPSIVCKKP